MLKLKYAGLTDQGRVRNNNEDAWSVSSDQKIFIVSDGMGGERAGELASKIVTRVLQQCLPKIIGTSEKLSNDEVVSMVHSSLCELSNHLQKETAQNPDLEGMGATVVVAVLLGKGIVLGHMGDSRCYLLRGTRMECLTKDHTMAQLLVDAGELSPEFASVHPLRSVLTCCVGMRGSAAPAVRFVDLQAGDRLLFCSDGLTGELSDWRIHALLGPPEADPEKLCRDLVNAANEEGGEDNITVLVINVEETAK
ncbi:MAG: hypothetical protein A2X49_10910 [Lentisphaerae bacterium GWF2_52_8]|nr:MAG: hypothetical protein A2X49_10910 [Lentisphaerae bacterium GWF2_52_8]